MKYCISINDMATFKELAVKFRNTDYSLEQLLELLKLSPLTWSFASKKIVEKEPDGSVCIPLTRYYFISEDNGIIPAQVADIIMKDPELQSQLTAYDCINLLSMINQNYTDISPLISLLTKFGLIDQKDHITNNSLIKDVQQIVYNSPKIEQLIKEDILGFANIISPHLDFIKNVTGIEVPKEFYEKVVHIYMNTVHQPAYTTKVFPNQPERSNYYKYLDFVTFLTHPINRKHVNIIELSKSIMNLNLIKQFEYTEEEINHLKTVKFMKDYLMFNQKNVKYFTIKEILNTNNDSTVIHAALTKTLTPEDVSAIQEYINSKYSNEFSSHKEKTFVRTEFRPIFIRDEICNGFSDKLLLYFLMPVADFDDICGKILDALFARNMNDEEKFRLFMKIPYDKKAIEFIISRKEKINNSCLIVYSMRANTQIVDKGTPIEDLYFAKSFSIYPSLRYESLFDYKVSKAAMAKALFYAIYNNNEAAFNLLISKGAPINVIIEGMTPLQYAISIGVKSIACKLMELGASLGFNGTKTAAFCAEESGDKTMIELFCSKINLDYESLFQDIRKIHIPDSATPKYPGIDIFQIINTSFTKFFSQIDRCFNCAAKWSKRNINIPQVTKLIQNEMTTVSSFTNSLYIMLYFTPVDIAAFEDIIPRVFSIRRILPAHERQEVWDFIVNNINESNKWFKAVYSVITGIKMIEEVENLSDLLYIATRLGNIEIITELLDKGARIEDVEGIFNRMSPSLEAISKDRSDILELFILHGLKFDHIYSIDNFTLLNASIEFNSTKCFDLLFSQTSFGHFVVETPMMSALQTFERTGNDYFINKLLPQIDTEYERIVDSSFCDYLLFKSGQIPEFHYNSAKRPNNLPKPSSHFNDNSSKIANLESSDLIQKILVYQYLSETLSTNSNQKFIRNLSREKISNFKWGKGVPFLRF
ncbi:hypothetical protein TVAG_384120 [Trichomonas vaginalis G3]|uniref:Uncharacterized protein n=1 Tax=Trichomonas vaginalis (strain ATCC PRA-98 / G3) TaxID=412133 RepID=A2F0B1_TRIV3|nr:ankycorbin family [Trichomonas vaginalis G3]EAY01673.1 hypothetical protein TVAG_384120 [Trichomonas vaginalis G3]KAI5515697.1 ankycorbin family [Trichomonas vaginalis G3]|eukprot:XP_001314266.1 hypothetical protein [Trichomonas vaginalis G3]